MASYNYSECKAKMQLFHEGKRKPNFKAMKAEKMKFYAGICIDEGWESEAGACVKALKMKFGEDHWMTVETEKAFKDRFDIKTFIESLYEDLL